MRFHIRPALAADAAFLPAIEHSAAQAFLSLPAYAWLASHGVLGVNEHLAFIADGLDWLVLNEREVPVGFVCASRQGDALHIEELAVLHSHQGQGLGRQLIAHVREWAVAQGFAALTLTTFQEVPWNAPFYGRLGFVQVQGPELNGFLQRQLAHESSLGFKGRCAMAVKLR